MRTLNFQLAGDAGVDLIRLLVDGEHAALSVLGTTQGFPRLALAGILRRMAVACEDGGEGVMREAAQARLASPVAMEVCQEGRSRGQDHKKLAGAPCPICHPPQPRPPLRTA